MSMRSLLPLVVLLLAASRDLPAAVTPANVASLALKWEYPTTTAVTGDLVLDGGCLYVPSWSGRVCDLHDAR